MTEGHSGKTDVAITITLGQPAPAGGLQLSIQFLDTTTATFDTANPIPCTPLPTSSDICDPSPTRFVTVVAGETQATWTLGIVGDTNAETDETVVVSAVHLGAGWTPAALTITIKDDDSTTGGTSVTLTKPAGLVATGGPRRVTLRWNQPSSAEVQAIANYEYRQRKGNGAWGNWTAAGSRWRNAYGVTGLDGSGVSYSFQLRAKNSGGTGPASDTVSAKPYGAVGTVPSTPTGLTVQAGSNSALISWTASGDGVGGYCPTAGYFARVYEVAPTMPMAAESLRIDSGTSWYVDELRYPYRHYVEVYAESEDGCGEQSELATVFFWTSASNTNPSAPATRKLRTPFPVRDLSVDTSTSGQVTISWKKPVAIGGKRNKRCAYVDAGGNQATKYAAQTIEYNYYVYNTYTDVDIADEYFRSADATLSKTVTGLPAGTGHYLRVQVQAYSYQCDQWSKSRHYGWWSN